MQKQKVIFIHGNGGLTAHDHWFLSVKQALEKLGLLVIAQDFPDAILARESYWLPFIKQLGADQETILIGHSSGAQAAMRFAEKNTILGSVLVSPCYTDLGDETEKQSGYYNRPWDWEAIKKNQQWILQFSSTDDPYIPIEEARFVHEKLNTEYVEYTDQGHFMERKTFPEIVEAIKKKLILFASQHHVRY
jgi:uncharacterized protein